MIKNFSVTITVLFSCIAMAADVATYSAKSIKPVGAGLIELVDLGKIKIDGKILPYEGTKYIATRNIDSMTGVSGATAGCMLHYSSNSFTENISVVSQSCDEIISIIKSAQIK